MEPEKKKNVLCAVIFVFFLMCVILPAEAHTILLETENFEDTGGWVVDQQFMDQMGSPYLLAHGLGVPVKDATTTVRFPAGGRYRLWVRTRDWVAPWNAPGAPGKFQILINSEPVKTTFGTEGAEWHWQQGGNVDVTDKQVTLALHDLTGFEGRCDAILFTTDSRFVPPNRSGQMDTFRRKALGLPDEPENAGRYDIVVVGGGIAGTCTALSAARLGLQVALIQDRPVLGGNNSSEVRVWLHGNTNYEPYPRIGDVVKELEQKKRVHYGPGNIAELYEDEKKLAIIKAEKNVSLFLQYRANQVQADSGRIRTVIAQNIITGWRLRFAGSCFADCTGDGTIGYLAGADYDITLKGHMGRCNLWNVAETDKPVSFPRCLWALDLRRKPFPGRGGKDGLNKLGGWYWESGFDHDPFEKAEYIRDTNFRAMYGAWDCLKNVDKLYPNHKLNWAAYIAGKRESRRLLGDVILTEQDLFTGRRYPDGCVPTSWTMDLHLPDKPYEAGFEGDAFIAKAKFTAYPRPYWIPYRCLYSRNVSNLFMAGRDISVTHQVLGTTRVMRTNGMMGEVVGMAASLCKKHNTDPRSIYDKHLLELKELFKRGSGKTQ